ncbi:M56 family metallopeptidase [Enterocloster clostridioformis]|jgi:beta-lactamase regulating signal transducer with metallopeptidase domain|uniref:Peptidase M56 BlaR1 n=2 Tax=Bacillota TaxID=1239 RepID=A0A174V016_9FIRM|nr:M56 family metallopeptidase [Enterocloster clostridioformis]CUQ26501.1 peptidase M56 BlaR1 [Enterocloster clostridioformis]
MMINIGDFLIILVSASITTGSMLFLLVQIANREMYATTWIYNLLKIGMSFLTIPLVILIILFLHNMTKATSTLSIQPDFNIYYKQLFFSQRNSFFKPYYEIAFFIWILGALFQIIKIIKSILKFYFIYIKSSTHVVNERTIQIVYKVKCELNINKKIYICHNTKINVPTLVIINRPIIFIGNVDFTNQELLYIIKHELIHLKRKHIFFKRLGIIIQIFYWFNPLLYYFSQFFNEYCELDCDREALENENMSQRLVYANVLLKLLSQNILDNPIIESNFCGRSNPKSVERRFENIMNTKKRRTAKTIIFLSLCYILCCPIITYGAVAGGVKAQSHFIKNILIKNVDKTELSIGENTNKTRIIANQYNLDLRGNNEIDDYLAVDESIIITVTAKSTSIRVNLSSDSSSDVFGIGIGDNYVSSSDGMISYTFKTVPNQQYKIYIDNLSKSQIHINGHIYI